MEDKLKKLRAAGVNPYPEKVARDMALSEVVAEFDSLLAKTVRIAGRVALKREHGKISFCVLSEPDAALQVIFNAQTSGFNLVPQIDLGDILAVVGTTEYSRTGEKSVVANSFQWAAKALRLLPKEQYKISDEEALVRKPYLGTLLYPEKRKTFEARSAIIQHIRNFLIDEKFIEVETPILQKTYGGALAEPFKTHLNALDQDVYLRIAPELYLKKMIVGGFERVFEIGKDFRNEGVDREHNPEFTFMELYAAWQDREYLIDLTKRLMRSLVKAVHGTAVFPFRSNVIDVGREPAVVRFADAFREACGLDYFGDSLESFFAAARRLDVEVNPKVASKGRLADDILKEVMRPRMIQPTFLIDHPKDMAPLAKSSPDDPRITRYMQFFMGGAQLVTSYAELNDPVEQRQRFEEQRLLLAKGDREAHPYDESFVEALEYGMPPTAGYGLGIDRLIMVLLNQRSLKDVIYFPFVR